MPARSFSIEAIFKAVDRMSNPLKGMNRNTSKFTRALKTDFAKAQRSVDRFTKNLKQKLGRGLRIAILGIGLAVAAGVGIAAKEFVDFENTVTAASAKFGAEFQKGTEGFIQLGKAAREIGATTEFSATEAAKGLDFLALAGFNATQSMSLLPGVVDLATASQTDLASASDIASDSLGAFGLMTEDSTQLAGNFARVMDVMAKTTTTSNTDLATLFETVKKGAASFTASGQSLETFNALAGKLATNGLKGAESGTALRNVMLRLAKPTGEAADILKQLGIQTQDSQGNFRDVIDIIADFEKGLVGMGTAQKTAALATVFGARTVTGINLLLAEGSDSLREYRTELEGSTGAASEMADVMRQSLQNRIKTLQSAALELGFKFVEAFEKKGGSAIDKITEIIRNFDVEPVLNALEKAFEIGSNLFNIFMKLSPVILTVVGAMALYKGVLLATALLTKGLVAAMGIMRAAQFIYIAATQGMTVAQAAFNGVALANPIGLIVVAIGLLIGAGILLVKNWDKVKFFFISLWGGIRTAFLTAIDFIKGILFTFADLILTIFGNVFKAVLTGASKVGEFLGFDTSGLDATIAKIEEVQAAVRKESMIGGRETRGERIRISETISEEGLDEQQRLRVQPPVSSAERANVQREESLSRAELLIRDETGRAEMTQNPNNNNFNFELSQSGGF